MSENESSNLQKALEMIGKAKRQGAQLVCLPELFTSQYFPQEKKALATPTAIPGPVTDALSKVARESQLTIIAGSIYEVDGADRYNTCVVFGSTGSILGKYHKIHLPEDPGFYEQDYFKPGTKFEVFDTGNAKVGPLICFDQWYPEAARAVKLLGADIICYPTAIGTIDDVEQAEGSWQKAWESVQIGHAISNSVIVACVNRVGKEKAMNFWGGSFVCDQFGKILVHAADEEGVFLAECDFDLASQIESGWGFLKNRRPSAYQRLVET